MENPTPKMVPQTFHFGSMLASIFDILASGSQLLCLCCDRILVSFKENFSTPSAVAGTQLCCAVDPPRQAYGLRMAYGVNLS